MTRRTVLLIGAAGTSTVALGALGLAAQPSLLGAPPEGGLEVLSLTEYSVLAAAARRLLPPLGEGAPGSEALSVARHVDRELALIDPEVAADIKGMLALLESGLIGTVLGEHVRPFTRLAPEEQDRVLGSWRSSAIAARRAGFKVLKGMTAAIYFSMPETWQRIGYPGPPSPAALRAGFASNLVDLDGLRAGGRGSEHG